MLPNKYITLCDSQKIYQYIQHNVTCSFNELQSYSRLDNLHLCMALLELIQEKKILPESSNGKISYTAIA